MRCPGWGVETFLPSGKVVLGCDTPGAVFPELYKDNPKLTAEEVFEKIPQWPTRVTITGGEPLMQPRSELAALFLMLFNSGHTIDIFSNGTLRYQPLKTIVTSPLVTMCVDFKLPGSGEYSKFCDENFEYLGVKDEIKFVIKDEYDYQIAKATLAGVKLQYPGLKFAMGPVWGVMNPKQLIEWVMRDKLNVRLNLQTHQLLGVDQEERSWHYE